MSEPRDPIMIADADDAEFDAFLRREHPLSQALAQGEDETAGSHLDALILERVAADLARPGNKTNEPASNDASIPGAPGAPDAPIARRAFWRTWQAPLGMAAMLGIGYTLLHLQAVNPDANDGAPVSAPASAPAPSQAVSIPAMEQETPAAPARVELQSDSAAPAAVANHDQSRRAAPVAAPANMQRPPVVLPAAPAAPVAPAPAMSVPARTTQAQAPATVTSGAPTNKNIVASRAMDEPVAAPKMALTPPAAAPQTSKPAAPAAKSASAPTTVPTTAPITGPIATSVPAAAEVRSEKKLEQETVTGGSDNARSRTAASPPVPARHAEKPASVPSLDAELQALDDLLQRHEYDAAREAWLRWRAKHPDQAVDAGLAARLKAAGIAVDGLRNPAEP